MKNKNQKIAEHCSHQLDPFTIKKIPYVIHSSHKRKERITYQNYSFEKLGTANDGNLANSID